MKIALVGGSNCLINDGFGFHLEKRLSGHTVVNHALGASSLLRGLHLIHTPAFEKESWDRIVVEYTINDYIFEQQNALDPILHARMIANLAAVNGQTGNIFLVLLANSNSVFKAVENNSLVYANYRMAIDKLGIRGFDAHPLTVERLNNGATADDIYQDVDHLKPPFAAEVAALSAQAILAPPPEDQNPVFGPPGRFSVVSDFRSISGNDLIREEYKTRVADTTLTHLPAGEGVRFTSPGGPLAGLYIRTDLENGYILIQTPQQTVVKNMMDVNTRRRGLGFYCLRHFVQPIPTNVGDTITIRLIEDWRVPQATRYDPSQGERTPDHAFAEQRLALASALFYNHGVS